MSYQITVCITETEAIANIDIHSISEHYTSVRKSQFQCIGWLLETIEKFECILEDTGAHADNPDYAVEILTKYSGLSTKDCQHLLRLKSNLSRFEFVWSRLSNDEKHTAITLHSDHWDNFWPGFEMFQIAAPAHPKDGIPRQYAPPKTQKIALE